MAVLPRTSKRGTTVFDPTLILSRGVYLEANSTVARCGVHEELNGPCHAAQVRSSSSDQSCRQLDAVDVVARTCGEQHVVPRFAD